MVNDLEHLVPTRKVPGQISVQELAIRSEIFRNFSKSLLKNYPQYLKLRQNYFLPHPFHFTILQFEAIQTELLAVSLW
jgi:hypothetical protein